jgi:hypothetical protein
MDKPATECNYTRRAASGLGAFAVAGRQLYLNPQGRAALLTRRHRPLCTYLGCRSNLLYQLLAVWRVLACQG